MSRRSKFSSLEIELASSILYYDREEMDKFEKVYDSIVSDDNIVIDGQFQRFVSYIKKFEDFDDDHSKNKENIISHIIMMNNNSPNKNKRDIFELWFEKVSETSVPMELSEDILDRFVWSEFKKAIEEIDKSDIPFKDKISVRPKIPEALDTDGLVMLEDIEVSEDEDSYSFTTGLEELDRYLTMRRTNFIVVAARPGVGKSLLMLYMAMAQARRGVKTLFISLEMSQHLIDERLVSCYIGENIRARFTNEEGKFDAKSYNIEMNRIKSSRGFKSIRENLQLYVSKSSNAETILDRVEKLVTENGYDSIFIDYLQLLRYVGMDEWSSLRHLTNSCKSLAFRNNILLCSATQVSRSSTERGLTLADLYGSATIEADADAVVGLENPRERVQGQIALINIKLLKNRSGDMATLKFRADYSVGRLEYSEE